MTAIEGVVRIVREAVALRSKRSVAMEAGLNDTVLRGVEGKDWNPTKDTLIALEPVARRIVAEADRSKAVDA